METAGGESNILPVRKLNLFPVKIISPLQNTSIQLEGKKRLFLGPCWLCQHYAHAQWNLAGESFWKKPPSSNCSDHRDWHSRHDSPLSKVWVHLALTDLWWSNVLDTNERMGSNLQLAGHAYSFDSNESNLRMSFHTLAKIDSQTSKKTQAPIFPSPPYVCWEVSTNIASLPQPRAECIHWTSVRLWFWRSSRLTKTILIRA